MLPLKLHIFTKFITAKLQGLTLISTTTVWLTNFLSHQTDITDDSELRRAKTNYLHWHTKFHRFKKTVVYYANVPDRIRLQTDQDIYALW
jgi:hypothetical protein